MLRVVANRFEYVSLLLKLILFVSGVEYSVKNDISALITPCAKAILAIFVAGSVSISGLRR
jgi:hypothetical protein